MLISQKEMTQTKKSNKNPKNSDASVNGLAERRKNVKIVDLPQKWVFDSEKDMGTFIYKLHAMTLLPGNKEEKIKQTIEGCKNILGVKKNGNKIILNWPMKAIIAKK